MNATQLLAHFDRLAEAPNAVPRLRRFILDLAVRGKLVEQDAGDESAAELLTRIRAEKAGLIKAGKLKRGAVEAPAADSEPQFVLPMNWIWAQLGEVAQYGISNKVDSNAAIPSNTWVLDLEDIEKDTSRLLNQIESEARPFSSTKTAFKQSDVLFGKLRPYLNKVIVADRDGVCTTEIIPIRGYCGLSPEYTKLVLRSPLTMATVDRLMYGMKMPRLGTADATSLSYPLPPLAEQHRIVAKVDELMALCDQLEAAQQERERRRDRLAAASLQRLNQPAADTTPATQREHARFHLHHLPRLTTRPEHIKAMRQTILNLAVSGKLLEQAVDAEPASVLLKRLQADIKSYGVQNRVHPAAISAIPDSAAPYPLPGRWIWARLASLCRVVTDGDHLPPPKSDTGVAFLTIGNVSSGALSFANSRYVSQEYFDKITPYRKPEMGDILYTVVGASYGRPVLVETDQPFCVQRHIAILKPAADLQLRYLHLLLKSQLVYNQATASLTGTAQPTIPLRPLRNFLVPLPPLAIQHRIVAKVDGLMALCDQLEAELTTTQADSRRLLEAVLEAALMPVN